MAALRRGQGAFTISPLAPACFAKLALSQHFAYRTEILYPVCWICQAGSFPFLADFFPFTITHSPVRAHWPQPQQETVPLLSVLIRYQTQVAAPNTSASKIQVSHVIPNTSCFLTIYHRNGLSVSGIRNTRRPKRGKISSAGAGRMPRGISCASMILPSGRGSVR